MAARFAIYWVPPVEHPLWAAGCAWLGRDPGRADPGTPPPQAREPWRYGFHATLKPPMRLAEGRSPEGLCAAARRLAATLPAFDMPRLAVAWLGDFLALRPAGPPPPALPALAEACLRGLDDWRALPLPAELAARAPGLSPAQQALLQRWGYPHVLDHWRFHMTLSDARPADAPALQQAAEAHFAAALALALPVREIAVFHEPGPGQPLRLIERCPMAPPTP